MIFLGFSTGAVGRSDFKRALQELRTRTLNSIELSALRFNELRPLLESIPSLDLHQYGYISLHAPSQFNEQQEHQAVHLLSSLAPRHWPIVVHPDTIRNFSIWRAFGARLAVENMDRRKGAGRTADELKKVFSELPEASLCFDIGHARQFDTTMTEAYRILRLFRNRLCQVHISEVNSASQHDRLSFAAIVAFEQVANLIPESVPVIIESRVSSQEIDLEIIRARQALRPQVSAPLSA